MASKRLRQYVMVDCQGKMFTSDTGVEDDITMMLDYEDVKTIKSQMDHFQRVREHWLRECAEFGLTEKALWRLKRAEREIRKLVVANKELRDDLDYTRSTLRDAEDAIEMLRRE